MRRCGQTVVLALAFSAVLCALGADGATKPCDCWFGSVTDAATCTCTCDSGYLLPYCAYGAGDNVTIQIVYDAQNTTNFVSQQAESQVASHYPSLRASMLFLTFDDTDNAFRSYYAGRVVALFDTSSALASAFLNDVRASATWLSQPTGQQLPILDAAVLDLRVAPRSDVAGSTLYNGAYFAIHTQDIVFLVVVVVLVIALVLECVCVENQEDVVAEKRRTEMESGRVASAVALQFPQGGNSPRPEGSSTASSPKAQPEAVVLVLNPMMTA